MQLFHPDFEMQNKGLYEHRKFADDFFLVLRECVLRGVSEQPNKVDRKHFYKFWNINGGSVFYMLTGCSHKNAWTEMEVKSMVQDFKFYFTFVIALYESNYLFCDVN